MSTSMNIEDITRIQKKLSKMAAKEEDMTNARQYLEALQNATITLDILHKTRIGATVNSLRKSINDPELVTISKDLIKKWKKLLDKDEANKAKASSGNGSNNQSPNINNTSSKASTNGKDKNGSSSSSSSAREEKSERKESGSGDTMTTDQVRIKCRSLIANALKTPFVDGQLDDESSEDLKELNIDTLAEEIAIQIEENLFKEFKMTGPKYNTRARSRISNLSDKRNPDLRLNVLKGIIKPDQMARMESHEMASADMKKMREDITKEMIREHQMSMTGGTTTDLIKCPKCKKANCTYNQVQTRSADEPMTTFCLCNECGKRWKFC